MSTHPDPMLIVYDMLSADASQPSIFAPLFFAAYSHCASHTLGSPRAWQPPTAQPGFRLSQSSLRVRSATTVICGIIVPPLPLAQALPCLSTRARLTVVFLTFSVLAQGGGGVHCHQPLRSTARWEDSIMCTKNPPPLFRGPGFPESARNVSPNQWISESGRKKDHLLKVFVLW